MICSHCVREVPDGSSFCPRCGGPLSPAESAPQPAASEEIHALLDDGGGWEPAVTTKAIRSGRGWEQTGRFESATRTETKLPAYSMFSARGRLNRLKYWYFILFETIAVYIVYFGLLFHFNSISVFSIPLALVYLALLALIGVLRVFATIKRFHDIDEPGVNVLMMLIPFYNLYVGCKLLFKASVREDSEYGGMVKNHWYWQVPATLIVIPILYFTACFSLTGDSPVTAMLTGNMGTRQYYNEKYGVGITFPAGWIRTDIEGCTVAAKNWSGTQYIALEVASSDGAPSFDEFSDEDFDAFMSMLDDKESFANRFDLNEADISNLSISKTDISGRTFVQAGFRHRLMSADYRHIFIMGIYREKAIALQLMYPESAPGSALDIIMESVGSLVVEDPTGD